MALRRLVTKKSISEAFSLISLDSISTSARRPPKLILPEMRPGCYYKHWLVVMKHPETKPGEEDYPTREQIVASYVETLAKVVGSEEKAKKKIYSVSTKHYFAFGARISEELSCKLKGLNDVLWVLPDSYVDLNTQDYGGEPVVDGQVVPYDPLCHKTWDGHLDQVLDRIDWRSHTWKTLNNFLRSEEISLNKYEFDRLCMEGKVKQARELLALLDGEGIQVGVGRYFMLMKACGEARAKEEAKNVHHLFNRRNFPFEISSINILLEMYCMCGSMDRAWKVFNTMPQRNITSWDTMIRYLAKNGHPKKAIDLFVQLKTRRLGLNDEIFVSVFTACSLLGDIEEMMLQFESMGDCGIVPSMRHYVAIVDILGSRGDFGEALRFIKRMPIEPNIDVWNILMYHSMIQDNMELVDCCAVFIKFLISQKEGVSQEGQGQ